MAKIYFKYRIWVSGSQIMTIDMSQQQRSSTSAGLQISSGIFMERSLGLAAEQVINTLFMS